MTTPTDPVLGFGKFAGMTPAGLIAAGEAPYVLFLISRPWFRLQHEELYKTAWQDLERYIARGGGLPEAWRDQRGRFRWKTRDSFPGCPSDLARRPARPPPRWPGCGVWQQAILTALDEAAASLDRQELLERVVAASEAPAAGKRDQRREQARRALSLLVKRGIVQQSNGRVFLPDYLA